MEDEATVRILVAEVLEDVGYVAIDPKNGLAGLAVLRAEVRIELLVTDGGSPSGINGRQVPMRVGLFDPS